MKVSNNLFNQIIAPENLFLAWDKFKTGKRAKMDVQEFEENLEYHLFQLHQDLKNKTYKHGPYFGFYINDPKRRHTHKAIVRDRVLHHAIFQILMPIFDATFIPTSYSCRVSKGTHKGVEAVAKMLNRVSKNNTQNCYALKCDIQKFFDSVNHEVLFRIIEKKLQDSDLTWLIREIVGSYTSGTGRNERERERELFGASRRYRYSNWQSDFPALC